MCQLTNNIQFMDSQTGEGVLRYLRVILVRLYIYYLFFYLPCHSLPLGHFSYINYLAYDESEWSCVSHLHTKGWDICIFITLICFLYLVFVPGSTLPNIPSLYQRLRLFVPAVNICNSAATAHLAKSLSCWTEFTSTQQKCSNQRKILGMSIS